ncbi:hypothetical protein M5K25_016305 [Dendrobium thyrsiflorum]|uniref:Uncharacterized protein n=1 Tax=Dendrobium thyrsiflorum TaxID=117978 RepID=A0ABD0UR98_DENTH
MVSPVNLHLSTIIIKIFLEGGFRKKKISLVSKDPTTPPHQGRKCFIGRDLMTYLKSVRVVSMCSIGEVYSYLTIIGVSLHDTFGLNLYRGAPLSKETTEPSSATSHTSPALSSISEDLFLVEFLATLLYTFALLLRVGIIHYNALLTASQLSQGQHHSLALAILTRINRYLHVASDATSLKLRYLNLSWHYLYKWIHLYILSAFSCLEYLPYFAERG